MAKCVVLKSTREYSDAERVLLDSVLAEEPDLVAVCGEDCDGWEDAIDLLCVELDVSGKGPGAFCNTSSHPGEDLAAVVAFAEQWCDLKGWPRDVRIVEV